MTEHPAVLKVQELYGERGDDDRLRPLTPNEEALFQNVTRILWRTIKSNRWARELFTEGSGAYDASVNLARVQEKKDLTAALESYERRLEMCP